MVSYLTLLPLSKDFVSVVHFMLLCVIVAELLAIFIDAHTRIKGTQMGNHEIEIVNFADGTTFFLRDFRCLTKIELILKLKSF